MSTTKDCGDLTVAVVIRTGVKYLAAAVGEDDTLFRTAIDEKIADILPQLEKTILDQICDHIGYDQETVAVKITARDDKNEADREAEETGRAEKQAKRDGLPPLQPHPPLVKGLGAPAPSEGASEQETNTAE